MNLKRIAAFVTLYLCSLAISAGSSCLADSPGAAITITPPLSSAQTIQVTETIYEAANGAQPGPIRLAGSITFKVQRPDKFRIDWKSPTSGPQTAATPSLYVSDGNTLTILQGKHFRQTATAKSEWPFPLVGLLNNAPPGGPIQVSPVQRDGQTVLLAVQSSPMGRTELTFDPTTHLLLCSAMYITFQGKTSEVMRTDFTNWVLNKPLPASTFRWVPPAGVIKAR